MNPTQSTNASTAVSHTPGPWSVMAEEVLGAYGIATVVPATGSGVVCRVPGNDKTPDERDANARLIAAAPELLEALKQIKDDYEELARNHAGAWHDDEVLLHQKINEAARAAIAKATGAA